MILDEAIKHAEEVADKKKRERQKWDKWLESDSDHRAVAEKVSCERCAEEHRQLAEWLKELKQLREQKRWILVSEKLPEVGSEVLVCYDFKGKRSVYIADFYGDGKFHGIDDEYLTTEGRKYRKAIAWMPLPTPPKMSEIPTGAEGSDKE